MHFKCDEKSLLNPATKVFKLTLLISQSGQAQTEERVSYYVSSDR